MTDSLAATRKASPASPPFPGPDGRPTHEHGWHNDIAGVQEAGIKRVKVMFYLTVRPARGV